MVDISINHGDIPSGYDIHSLPWKDPPFLSSVNPGKPSIPMGHLYHGELLVITRLGNWFNDFHGDEGAKFLGVTNDLLKKHGDLTQKPWCFNTQYGT